LPKASLDARAIVRLAKNPRCQRLAALTMVGSSPGKAMDHVFVPGFSEKQSKFALTKGTRFENIQADNGAARLFATLQNAQILGPTDLAVRDLKAETSSIANKKAAMLRGMALTDDILRQKAAGDPSAPNLILQAALGVPLGSGEIACVRPDILVARPSERIYRPGDMKSYAFMRHLTEPRDVGQAAAQIGVYGMALERRLNYLGIPLNISPDGVIVMVRPGGLQSVARLQNIERDISTARRIIDVRPRTLAEVAIAISPEVALDNRAAILRLRPCYNGKCRAFCQLHEVCRAEAMAGSNPSILGDDAEALLSGAGCTIVRADQLLNGAAPTTPDELALQKRLQVLETEWRAAS
jgi:hypothetical protein